MKSAKYATLLRVILLLAELKGLYWRLAISGQHSAISGRRAGLDMRGKFQCTISIYY